MVIPATAGVILVRMGIAVAGRWAAVVVRMTLTPAQRLDRSAPNPLSAYASPVDAEALRYVIFLQRIDRGEVLAKNNQRAPVRGSIMNLSAP
jgi:hypothetical protein